MKFKKLLKQDMLDFFIKHPKQTKQSMEAFPLFIKEINSDLIKIAKKAEQFNDTERLLLTFISFTLIDRLTRLEDLKQDDFEKLIGIATTGRVLLEGKLKEVAEGLH